MDILNEVAKKINRIFDDETLDNIAKATGFISRKRKITAKKFLENNLLLELSGSNNSLEELSYEFSQVGCEVSKQALHKKQTSNAILFFKELLGQLLGNPEATKINLEKLSFLEGIKVVDSSEIKLHKRLQKIFPQVRKQGAAVKLQAIMNVMQESLLSLEVCDSHSTDQGYRNHKKYINKKDLLIADLGYFRIDTFKEIIATGGYFLSRYFKKSNLYTQENRQIDLRSILSQTKEGIVELSILLGTSRLSCRCVAVRLTEEAYQKRLQHISRENRKSANSKREIDLLDQWTIFVTNLPVSLTGNDLLQIYRLRWQIELLFKMMKTFLRLRKIEYTNQYRAQISLYISLIAMTILCMISMSIVNKEISLYKAGKMFVRNIREFINRMRKCKQHAIEWFESILCKFALKESRLDRPSTKMKLLLLEVHYA